MGYANDRSTKATSISNPTSLNLQPRPFAPLESGEKEEAVARKSGYSENFLEKIINTPRSESATPVQRKSGNRLKAIAAERNNAALQNQSIQRQESVEEKNEGKQEVSKEFIMNPEPLPVQRKLENHLRAKNAQKMAIQAKLAIGEPNDKYEQEADATAARVVQQINSPITSQSQPVQRKFENHLRAKNAQKMALQPKLAIGDPNGKYEQEDDATAARGIQQINSPTNDASTASLTQSVQRQEMQEDEELQMKSLVQRRENIGGGEASTDLESSIQSARGSGQSLDANLQRSMGQAMGADFSGVKVHTDSQSDQLNKSIQAKAFTTGQDVFFRQGAYEPSSRGGQELIAHELTHVVQQNGGAVQRSPENVIQRWDSIAYETQNPDNYKSLLGKMNGLTPAIGVNALKNLADLTDSPEQLDILLTRMGTSHLKNYLKSPNINASTLMKLTSKTNQPQAPGFIKLVNDLIKFKVPIETYLENPAATLSGVQAQIVSAEASAKMAAGLISANGTEIEFTDVNAVVGDGQKDEKAAVKRAVAALDQGTLLHGYHGNGEGNLPGVSGAGGYKEYYVDPPKGTNGPGARRLVVRDANHFIYYSWNHYGQNGTVLPAFKRIKV